MLKDFIKQAEEDFNDNKRLRLGKYKIDFHKSPNNILGSFKDVIHKKETKDINPEEGKTITYEVIVHSRILQQYVKVALVFVAIDEDELNNAYLHEYAIYDLQDNLLIRSAYKGNLNWNYSSVKKSILYFLYGQHAMAEIQTEVGLSQALSCEPNSDVCSYFTKTINKIYQDCGGNSLVSILEWQFSGGHHYNEDGSASQVQPIVKYSDEKCKYNNIDLGLFCYFPVLEILKDETKDSIKDKIYTIANQKSRNFSDFEKQLIDLLLKKFSENSHQKFLDFILEFENETLFRGTQHIAYANVDFPRPDNFPGWNQPIFDDSNLPEEANWEVYLLTMDALNNVLSDSKEKLVLFDDINSGHYYYQEYQLSSLFNRINEDILVQILPGDLYYTGTSAAQLKRMYSIEENSDFEQSLRLYFDTKRQLRKERVDYFGKKKGAYVPSTFLNKWVKEFKLGDRIEICSHAEGYGVTIRVFDTQDDKVGMILSEKGYGTTQIFAILLKIENAIMQSQYNDIHYKYDQWTLGDNLKQLLRTYSVLHPITIALEEPENHLHPSMQSLIADMIIDAFATYGIHFLVETHSEYTIRKLQLLTAQKKIDNDTVSLLYVNSKDRPKYMQQITNIGIADDGTLNNEFGTGFFDESLKLSKALFNPIEKNEE